jgi:hypothetical protein
VSRGDILAGSTLPGPLVEHAVAQLFGVHAVLPSQWPERRRAARGPTALLAGVLANALDEAGVATACSLRWFLARISEGGSPMCYSRWRSWCAPSRWSRFRMRWRLGGAPPSTVAPR